MPVPGTTLASWRPVMQGTHGVVVAGHPDAAMAGLDILRRGGNAIDAGVAVGLALNVVHSTECNFLGVAPTVIYSAQTGELAAIDGLGVWPKAVSLDYFKTHHQGKLAPGIARAITPGAPDTWFGALSRFGTLRFAEVAEAAIRLADEGFPADRALVEAVRDNPQDYTQFPGNEPIYIPEGRAPQMGEMFCQKDLAATLRRLVAVEQAHQAEGRVRALQATRDFVYRGELAQQIVAYSKSMGGLLSLEDLAACRARWETPVTINYRGYDVYTTGPWGQGPVFPLALKLLEGFDLKKLGLNSTQYIHLVNQALNLAFSDREAYMGDPDFVDVPIKELLSEAYARERRKLIDPDCAWPAMPPAGDPRRSKATVDGAPQTARQARADTAVPGPHGPGTSYYAVIDRHGNMFSCTPSEGARLGPVIPGTGMCISLRGSQSHVEAGHPAALAPGKRPRLTPTSALILKDGKPVMTVGGHGGDHITQGMLQVFLNISEFGLNPQEAVESPRFYSYSFPGSTYPHAYQPGLMRAEGRIDRATLDQLKALGHRVESYPDVWEGACLYGAITRNPATGLLQGGADPRGEGYALSY